MIYIKIIVGSVLIAVWAIFAALGKTPLEPLIDFIKTCLVALATHSIIFNDKSKPKDPENENPKISNLPGLDGGN